ncbi:MAG: hypothetical protein EOP06_07545 [Proteobacteria bacterium]|nr:MAG: hypothetical protein EOP06_07545 [Pseudomonadota bacterium]
MKFSIPVFLTSLISVQCFADIVVCEGIRPATPSCAAQRVHLRINTTSLEFKLQSLMDSDYSSSRPTDPCYELSSGNVVRASAGKRILSANRMVRFTPNYGGFRLEKEIIVGEISRQDSQLVLDDRMSDRKIPLVCR